MLAAARWGSATCRAARRPRASTRPSDRPAHDVAAPSAPRSRAGRPVPATGCARWSPGWGASTSRRAQAAVDAVLTGEAVLTPRRRSPADPLPCRRPRARRPRRVTPGARGRDGPPGRLLDPLQRRRSARRAHDELGRQHRLGAAPRPRPSASRRRSAITRPISTTGWRTVVSSGSVCRQTGESSNPTTATSSGTRRPAARNARRAPTAMRSEAANTASGRSPSASELAHRRPPRWPRCSPRARRAGARRVRPAAATASRRPRGGRGPTTCPADPPPARCAGGRGPAGARRRSAPPARLSTSTTQAGWLVVGRPPHTVGTPRVSRRAARSSWACSERSSTPSACWSVRYAATRSRSRDVAVIVSRSWYGDSASRSPMPRSIAAK